MFAEQQILQRKAILLGIMILLAVTKIQTYPLTATEEQQLEEVRVQAAHEWAPVVWLHPDEQFFPSDAHGFIKRTTHLVNGEEKIHSPSDRSGRSFGNGKITPLREGRASWDTYLIAPIDSDCPNCPIPQFLFGKHPTDQESPKVSAVINSCLPHKRRHRNRGRRTSHWTIINKHEIVSENDLFPQENNGSYAPKEKLHNQNNNSSSEQVNFTTESQIIIDKIATNANIISSKRSSTSINSENVTNQSITNRFSHLTSSDDAQENYESYTPKEKLHTENNFSHSKQVNLTRTVSQIMIDKVETNANIVSSNISSTPINYKNSSNISATNSFSHLTSSHEIFYEDTEPEINYHVGEQGTNNLNNTIHTFTLGNTHPDNLFNVPATRDKKVPINTNTDIPTENTDINTRTDVVDEAQDRSITEDGDNINPLHLTHNDISQTLSSYSISTQEQRFSVTYWTFYPYNHGKKVCSINLGWMGQLFKPRVNGVCHGKEIVMGNHVGDWEHVSIDFIGNTPEAMYISSHTFGAFYKYNPDKHLFYYTHQDIREGMNLGINFPDIVYMENNHPVLYAALGSHGLWSKAGVHQYSGLPLLYDVTASGVQWRTWENLDVIDLRNEDALSVPHRWWLGYEGRWGNPPKNCHLGLFNFCQQSHGPTGIPRKRVNFPCTS